jgi:hemerythrin-like domain-containing protein
MTVIYTGATDAVRQVIHHHALLRRGLERRAGALCEAAECGIPSGQQLRILRDYLARQILPHAQAEERTLYHAAATRARAGDLVHTLSAEHRELAYLAGRLRDGADATETAVVSERIATLFAGHVAKENDLLLPALTGAGVDLGVVLADMHAPHAGTRHAPAAAV